MKRILAMAAALVLVVCAVMPLRTAADENPVPKAKHAVVRVASGIYYKDGDLRTYDYRGYYSTGSAFGVSESRGGAEIFATSGHVVTDDDGDAYEHVYLCIEGSELEDESTMIKCEVLYLDEDVDLALLKAEEPVKGVEVLPLQYAEEMETGNEVYALGFPGIADEVSDTKSYTAEDITVTDGIVSRYIVSDGVNCIAHTATVNHGNSGGPLINEYGNAIGINTFIYTDRSTADLRSYAIYIDYVIEVMDELDLNYTLASGERIISGGQMSGGVLAAGAAAAVILIVVIVLAVRKRKNKSDGTGAAAALTLSAVNGPLAGQSWPLDGPLTLGRDPGCTVVFPPQTKGISRSHCRIEVSGNAVLVTDLGSTYGTYAGGTKLTSNVPVAVGVGTEICLGSASVKLIIQ